MQATAAKHWNEIKGWLTQAEGDALQRLARGARVLEIGSYHSRSTVCMAQVAEHVTAVDHGKGDEGAGFEPSTEQLEGNLVYFGAIDRVTVVNLDIETAAKMLKPGIFDLVFVDGAHDEASVKRDLAIAARLVKPAGIIALHDSDYPSVQAAMRAVLGWRLMDCQQADRLCWRAHVPHAEYTSPCVTQCVYLALPRRPEEQPADERPGTVRIDVAPSRRGNLRVGRSNLSLLNLAFNMHWCAALNSRKAESLTHFAMRHSDIVPAPFYLDTLIDDLAQADIISAVVPIKDERGLTTTGVRCTESGHIRRLTMTEVMQLPETFTLEDCHAAGIRIGDHDILVVNTGLWVCRFTEDWILPPRFPGFHSCDLIRMRPDGLAEAMVLSEDWCFSEWAAKQGLRLAATRKVALAHVGTDPATGKVRHFRNDHAWGTWQTDQGETSRV